MNEQATGQPVRALQTMLRQIAELDPAIPSVIPVGIYGRDTMAAVSALQRSRGLPVTGVTDLATWRAVVDAYHNGRAEINPAEPLQPRFDRQQVIAPGERNSHVWLVQSILAALHERLSSVPSVNHTGINDERTQAGVRWAQQASGLPQTGRIDRNTWQALARLYAGQTRDGSFPAGSGQTNG